MTIFKSSNPSLWHLSKRRGRPVYGTVHKIKETMDPLYLNFHEHGKMVLDVKRLRTFREKLFYLFGSPSAIAEKKRRS
jgi:hypothetical protein